MRVLSLLALVGCSHRPVDLPDQSSQPPPDLSAPDFFAPDLSHSPDLSESPDLSSAPDLSHPDLAHPRCDGGGLTAGETERRVYFPSLLATSDFDGDGHQDL